MLPSPLMSVSNIFEFADFKAISRDVEYLRPEGTREEVPVGRMM